jgi:ankyrin repeat protein
MRTSLIGYEQRKLIRTMDATRSDIDYIAMIRDIRFNGLSCNHQNNDGDTALHLAVKRMDWDICWELLKMGAKAHIVNNLGELALELYDYHPEIEVDDDDERAFWDEWDLKMPIRDETVTKSEIPEDLLVLMKKTKDNVGKTIKGARYSKI